MTTEGVHAPAWIDRRIRLNSEYRLVDYAELSARELNAVRYGVEDPALTALLVPNGRSSLRIKAVCSDARALVLAADGRRTTRELVAWTEGVTGERLQYADIAALVMDRVLELEIAGVFTSGAAAQWEGAWESADRTMLALRSRLALTVASHLGDRDEAQLTAALYSYGRQPLTPQWRRQIPNSQAVRNFLGIEDPSVVASLRGTWRETTTSIPQNGWFAWGRVQQAHKPARYKLYISPRLSELPAVLPYILRTLNDLPVSHFKIGADVAGLLRPDRFVAYVPSWAALQESRTPLAEALSGRCQPDGVPFTVEVNGTPAISWGRDPRPGESAHSAGHSWRSWLCSLAARALVVARERPEEDPVIFALRRLRLEGIDTTTWQPEQVPRPERN